MAEGNIVDLSHVAPTSVAKEFINAYPERMPV
ncbi:hypothetical protein SDC49_11045 [Lactobacillus sp. R2/2]|nr:hypothetical protein [Lactobacillus sp. R2/2]